MVPKESSRDAVEGAVLAERERCARYVESFAAGYRSSAGDAGELADDFLLSTLAFIGERLREPPLPLAPPADRYLDKFGHL